MLKSTNPPAWTTILFDVDGTLVASGELIMNSFQEALDELGRPRLGPEQITNVVGPPLAQSFTEFCGIPDSELDHAVETYRRIYLPHFLGPPMYEGIPELLADLREAGIHLGTATSKMETMARTQLEHLGIDHYFNVIAGAKPDPNSTKTAVVADSLERLQALGASPENAVLIGDRSHDVLGAENNQIEMIGAGWGYGSPEEFNSDSVTAVAGNVRALRDLLL